MASTQPPRLVTPEAVPLDFELAGIGSRFLALMLDWLLQGALAFSLFFALAASFAAAGQEDSWITATAALLLIFLVVWGYPVAMETLWRGRTLGKAALGLRVVTKEGAPIRFRHAAIRAVLGLVDFVLTSGAAAVLSALLTRDNQRVGDLVAGTIVVRERTGMRVPSAVTFTVPLELEPYVATLDVTGLSADEYAAVRAFLLRAHTLPPAVRADIAQRLASPLVQRLRLAVPAGLWPEHVLLSVATAYQRRQGAAAAPAAWAPSSPATPAPAPTPPRPGDFSPPA
jgi:uncharacterized RDD family membrane protein YckC